ncbi:MAG: exodeoxyribonuclease VII large subunit [Gammaproteobacteria bacterium]
MIREQPGVRDIYTVSRLTAEARILLESGFGSIWVEGELSNLARPSSGHIYFTLKDGESQVRCAMFRQRGYRLAFQPREGQQVLVRARVSIYQARGDFQLIIEHMEEAGDGLLRRAFEELKQRLDREGLFDPRHKRPLPRFPEAVGVITSPTGAAIRDILTTLKRRFPALPVVLYPVPVQGEGAAERIAAAIATANRRRECDVLIVGRGGGSLEDLWAFNEEVVARAIHASEIPVVAAVGHEVDFTIADFVADQRAPTPTAAAELVSPNRDDWLAALEETESRLIRQVSARLRESRQALGWLQGRLERAHPGRRLMERSQRLDELEQRLRFAWNAWFRQAQGRLTHASVRLLRHDPRRALHHLEQQRAHLSHRLGIALERSLREKRRQLEGVVRALDAVSPLATLERGYAIVQSDTEPPKVVRAWNEVKVGDAVTARLGRGRIHCRVEGREEK